MTPDKMPLILSKMKPSSKSLITIVKSLEIMLALTNDENDQMGVWVGAVNTLLQ